MKLHHAVLLLCAVFMLLTGCTQISIAEEEQLRSTTTAVAETIVPVPAETGTPVAVTTDAPTAAPTSAPTAAPTATSAPTAAPIAQAPAADPDLRAFSLCDQVAGDPAGGRFSARVTTITTTVEAKFERLEIGFSVPDSSVAPHALARCLSAADDAALTGNPQTGTGYTLLVSLDGWLHDDLFRASTVTPTLSLSGTTAIGGASYRVPQNADAGAELAIALKEPQSFRVALEQNPTRLVIEVAKTAAVSATSDQLTQASGTAPAPDAPLYYIQDGDVWSFTGGQATNLTNSPELETALAVSSATDQLAFCRAEAGAGPDDALAASSLWLMGTDGGDVQELAAPGRTCADPAFSPDGSTIALTVDEGSATPPRFTIYTVTVDGGDATRLSAASDEWSRFGPQWLDDGRVVYAAIAEDSRSTLFVNAQGTEEDIGAALTVGSTYATLGRPLVAPDGSAMAVEGVRADGSGASMLVLDSSGAKVDEIVSGYWVRPAAWGENGALYYLVTDCASSVAQNYGLFQRPQRGEPRPIAFGVTLGGFGQFVASGDTLAYVAYGAVPAQPRGPAIGGANGASGVWAFNTSSGARGRLVDAPSAISAITQ